MNVKLWGITNPRRPEETSVSKMVVSKQQIFGFICIAASAATLYSSRNVGNSAKKGSLRRGDPQRDLQSSSQLGFQFETPQTVGDPRYLTFGSSDTWGVGLFQAGINRSYAYPYLLSPDVTNTAGHMTDATYPAVCTESVTGDGIYDVIVVEYKPVQDSDSLHTLANRLRQRFPNALIIFLQLWDMYSIRTRTTTGVPLGFSRFQYATGVQNFPIQSAQFAEAVQNWTQDFVYIDDPTMNQQYQDTIQAVKGISLQLPRPDNARDALLDYTNWFTAGGRFLSEPGHAATAMLIKEVVTVYNVTGEASAIRNALGSWAPGDSCHLWFLDGNVDLAYDEAKVDFVMFDSNPGRYGEYYALEIQNGGSLIVSNPFNESRTLSLTYMAEGPVSTIYPRTLVYFNGSVGVLDPLISQSPGSQQIHQPRTTSVGKIEPGNTTLYFNILENDKPLPFRLTGASLLAFDSLPVEYTLELHQANALSQA
jgi:hypothetical protein